jgi:hypothetical protein
VEQPSVSAESDVKAAHIGVRMREYAKSKAADPKAKAQEVMNVSRLPEDDLSPMDRLSPERRTDASSKNLARTGVGQMSSSGSDRKKPPLSTGVPPFNLEDSKHWESVHICPKCGYKLNLSDIDLKGITTGIVSCPDCGRSGPIDIQIVDGDRS